MIDVKECVDEVNTWTQSTKENILKKKREMEEEEMLKKRKEMMELDAQLRATNANIVVLQTPSRQALSLTHSDGMESYYRKGTMLKEPTVTLNPQAKEFQPTMQQPPLPQQPLTQPSTQQSLQPQQQLTQPSTQQPLQPQQSI